MRAKMGFNPSFIIVLAAVGVLALGGLNGCGGAGSSSPGNRAAVTTSSEINESETSERVVLQIAGITCSSCVDLIEVALSQVNGVKDVVIDNTGKATIVFNPQKTNVETLKEAIRKTGNEVQ